MLVERGVIRNRKFAQQIRDFGGLRFGKITPTDIDAAVEFGDRLYVFVEAKHGDAPIPHGQRLLLERLCDALHQPPRRYAVVILASHDTDADIDFGALPVRMARWGGRWHVRNGITVRAAMDRTLAFVKALE